VVVIEVMLILCTSGNLQYLADGVLPLLKCFYIKFYKPRAGQRFTTISKRMLSALRVSGLTNDCTKE